MVRITDVVAKWYGYMEWWVLLIAPPIGMDAYLYLFIDVSSINVADECCRLHLVVTPLLFC